MQRDELGIHYQTRLSLEGRLKTCNSEAFCTAPPKTSEVQPDTGQEESFLSGNPDGEYVYDKSEYLHDKCDAFTFTFSEYQIFSVLQYRTVS